MADPLLKKGFSVTSLNQAVGVAAMCLQEEPSARPFISDISAALSFLAMAPPEAPIPERLAPMLSRVSTSRKNPAHEQDDHSSDSSEDDEGTHSDKQEHDQDYISSSEYEYSDSYDGSDYEETSRAPSRNERNVDSARCKSTKSKKLGSSSKRRSRKKSVKITSPTRSKTKKSSRSSSKRNGVSLKCDSSSFPEESVVPSNSGQSQSQQGNDHSDYSSSSDEERWDGSISQNRSNATELAMNSRSDSYNSRSEDEDDN